MSEQKISLTPLQNAVASLRTALTQPLNEFTRDATIKRFEYTYELSWKILKRYLSTQMEIEEHQIKSIFRQSARVGLINNLEHWFNYHKARNLTCHTYDEETADETYEHAKQFIHDVDYLLEQLEKQCGRSTDD